MAITVKCSPLVFQKAQTPSSYINWFLDYSQESMGNDLMYPTEAWIQNMINNAPRSYITNFLISMAGIIATKFSSSTQISQYGHITTLDYQWIDSFKYTFKTTGNNDYYDSSLITAPLSSNFPNTFILFLQNYMIDFTTKESLDTWAIWATSTLNDFASSDSTPFKEKLISVTFYPFVKLNYINLPHFVIKDMTKQSTRYEQAMNTFVVTNAKEGGITEGAIPVDTCEVILVNFEWDNNSKFVIT